MRTFFYKQLHLNDNKNNFDKNFNNYNYKKKIRKFHDAVWKNSYFTSAYAAMLVSGCGVSHYPQFYDQQLENYQFLARPCLVSFDREKLQNKNGY